MEDAIKTTHVTLNLNSLARALGGHLALLGLSPCRKPPFVYSLVAALQLSVPRDATASSLLTRSSQLAQSATHLVIGVDLG